MKEKKIKVKTPMGTLIAYPSTDPQNPGIFIDLKRKGSDFMLNLSGTECQISEDGKCPDNLVTHIWGDGTDEDVTHRVMHVNIDRFFSITEEPGLAEKYGRMTLYAPGLDAVHPDTGTENSPIRLYDSRGGAAHGTDVPVSLIMSADILYPSGTTPKRVYRSVFAKDGRVQCATDWYPDKKDMLAERDVMQRKGRYAFDEIVEQIGVIV